MLERMVAVAVQCGAGDSEHHWGEDISNIGYQFRQLQRPHILVSFSHWGSVLLRILEN